MKHNQKGEAMLAVMVVVLAVVWLSGGHMGMMGHGNPAQDKSSSSSEKKGETSEHRH